MIESLKGGKKSGIDPLQKSLLQVRGDLHKAKQRIEDLEADLREAEEAAHDKAEELSEVIARIRKYEKGKQQ